MLITYQHLVIAGFLDLGIILFLAWKLFSVKRKCKLNSDLTNWVICYNIDQEPHLFNKKTKSAMTRESFFESEIRFNNVGKLLRSIAKEKLNG